MPIVDYRKTYCNDFYGTLNLFGIEVLYNLLAFELTEMVNRSGYINVEYPQIVASTTTAKGVSPMTSQGANTQKKNVLSQITFDNAAKYILEVIRSGKFQKLHNVSASIFIGTICRIGTGFVNVSIDETKLTNMKALTRDYEDRNLIEADEDIDPYYENISEVLFVKPSKFPKISWVVNRFVSRDYLFYVNFGIKKISNYTLTEPKKIDATKFMKSFAPFFKPVEVTY